MRQDDHCDLCSLTLEAACNTEGEQFCKLKEQYMTTDMSADDMYEKLVEITTPEQFERIDAEVRRLASIGWKPTDPLVTADRAQYQGQAAAQRWLDHYRNGR